MTVAELIAKLQEMPPAAEVGMIYDGAGRLTVRHVWLTSEGEVRLADEDEDVYYPRDLPVDCPVKTDWRTPRVTPLKDWERF
jgi:hypothetical protein